MRTKSLKKIFHFVKLEILRIIYYRYMNVFQTISLMTFFAIEMAVQLLHGTIMVVMTITIFGRATSVFHHVNHVVFGEKNQCPEYAGFVHTFQIGFQIAERECVVIVRDSL